MTQPNPDASAAQDGRGAIEALSHAARPWHALSSQEVLQDLESRPTGLDHQEAAARLERYGPNALVVADPIPWWRVLLAQGKSLVMALLLAAAGVALIIGDLLEAGAIGAVLILNTSIGFWVEWRARNAMEALRRIQVSEATVLRAGEAARIDARQLVPGDILLLEAGDAVPADGRLLSSSELRIVEAPLTGESVPVSKDPSPIGDFEAPSGMPLAERTSMVYKGTLAAAGSAEAVVVATGRNTEIGRIAELVQATEAEETPLEERLHALGRRLVWITLGIAAVVTGLGMLRGGEPWLMVQTGIALAIAAVPEGLPVVATITLALGMRRMAQRHALVRSLPAVETLGSATVVCADKTGTLTGGQMTATRVEVGTSSLEVTGSGLSLDGELKLGERTVRAGEMEDLDTALRIAVLANRAILSMPPRGDGGELELDGDPTEGALLVLGHKAGVTRNALLEDHPEVGEVPFSSERRMMATFHRSPSGAGVMLVKGAPERIVRAATTRLVGDQTVALDEDGRRTLLEQNQRLGQEGLRVLALAMRELQAGDDRLESAEVPFEHLTFVGLVGLEDPPAPNVSETIEALAGAGVRTVMVTGDQPVTAEAIGRRLGLHSDRTETLEGRALSSMSDQELRDGVEKAAIFSRIDPADKLRIVKAFQDRGEVVAMLGDGVNDAPALKKADIGVAMGKRGTDVAKETAGVVLQDDRFETIGAAVEEGRVVFDNIRKFIFYLFSCNLSEVLVILGAGLVGLPIPLLPLQILWLNLVTDVFPALALAVEPPEEDVMARPPRSPDAAILSRPFLSLVARHGLIITVSTLTAYVYALRVGDAQRAVTVAFMSLALAQLLHVFNARGASPVLFSSRFLRNPWVWSAIVLTVGLQLMAVYFPPLSIVLETVPLSRAEWGVAVLAASVPLLAGQMGGWLRQDRGEISPVIGDP